jgi:hypothetical protein
MTEKLLQFIWKNRYFNQQELKLITGEILSIEYSGDCNPHQGPDFLNARVWVNGNCWIGSVELHLFSSGWVRHCHSDDENYQNVILHVVWKKDKQETGLSIPELELCNRIPRLMVETYANWMNRHSFIPCELSVLKVSGHQWQHWKTVLVCRRLNRKMQDILKSLHLNQFHWEEQLWWMMAANIGNPVNTNAFEAIARSIPFPLLAKHRHQTVQIEALLLGQANLLESDFRDPYVSLLKREYDFLKKKYDLKRIYISVHFLRMRPENFPGIRLSQLARLFSENISLFSLILKCTSVIELRRRLAVTANDYWINHYVFEKLSHCRKKILGQTMCDNIIVNSIIPLLYTYGKIFSDQVAINKAVAWLGELPAEQNQVTAGWKRIGITIHKAAGSQALIELKKNFCDQRKCLDCEIGRLLLIPGRTI